MSIFSPLQAVADWLTYDAFRIARDTRLASAVDFFVFDTMKIFLLLAVVVFAISVVRSYLPPEKVRFVLARKSPIAGNLIAALVGVVTPFCSCSAIPLFLGFIQAGVPLGTTFSFLVASPMINEVALVLLLGMFGWRIASIYVVSGLAIAVVSGAVIGRMRMESQVEPFVFERTARGGVDLPEMDLRRRIAYAADYTLGIIKKVWPYVLIGIGVGAWMHGYVPADFLASYAGGERWYAVPLAVIVGIPLYSNAAGIVPFVSVLTEKGVAMGTTLAFMMSVTALSLPEFMILKKVMKPKLILVFASVVGAGILLTGYLFNAVL